MPNTLIIRADASTKIGIGHIMRCIALGQAWKLNGGNVIFVSADQTDEITQRLDSEGFEQHAIASAPASLDDATELKSIANQHRAQAIVIDGYQFDFDYVKAISDFNGTVMLIDDYGQLPNYPVDIVLNQNLGADPNLYINRPSKNKTPPRPNVCPTATGVSENTKNQRARHASQCRQCRPEQGRDSPTPQQRKRTKPNPNPRKALQHP